jgi:hypothetical protein
MEKYDFVIHGASGFTGQFVVEYVYRAAQEHGKAKKVIFKIFFMYCIQHCFICRPSDFTVSEDAGIEPMDIYDFCIDQTSVKS